MNGTHPQNPTHPDDTAVAPFPIRLLTGTLLFTVGVLLAMGWSAYDSYRNFVTVQSHDLRLAELQGTIVHLDEVLTMSARMAATTGDPQWERLYRQFEAPLDDAVKETMRLTKQSASAEAAQQTHAANLKLVEMEDRALAFVRAGQVVGAKEVLFSDAYEAQKKIYAVGMATLIQDIKVRRATSQHDMWRRAFLFGTASLLAVALLAFIWWKVLGRLQHWRAAIARAVAAQHSAREDLEKRIEERTRQLQTEVGDHQRTVAGLQLSEEHLRTILDMALDAVITMNSAGRITGWNPQAETIFGWTRAEAVGRTLSETIIPERYREAHSRGLKHFLATGEGPVLNRRIEISASRRDGGEFPIELAITPLKTAQAFNFAAFIRDISARQIAAAELEKAHQELLETSRRAGMAEVATGVLHNVGNVLNSVNVSATLVIDQVRRSKAENLPKLGMMLQEHAGDLADFLSNDPRGRTIPVYLLTLGEQLSTEQKVMVEELEHLRKNIEHIKDIVAMQQSHGKVSGAHETVALADLVEDALGMNASRLRPRGVEVVRDYQARPTLTTDRNKVLQILVNLIGNAEIACVDSGRQDKQVTVRLTRDADRVRVAIIDNGVGIPPENLTRVFNHGFTTRKDGHGFGLHSGALAAKELGGSLNVQSEGPGQGATFTLELPLPLVGKIA